MLPNLGIVNTERNGAFFIVLTKQAIWNNIQIRIVRSCSWFVYNTELSIIFGASS